MNGPDRAPYRLAQQAVLLASPARGDAAGDPNRSLLASLVAGQSAGFGCLPADLGLGPEDHARLLAEYFPGARLAIVNRPAIVIPEWEDLYKLLADECDRALPSAAWMSRIVATACAGSDHLWQDLGLSSRDQLSALMRVNFPGLAESNSGDMKWKKFLYRQVCSREGIYVCPAPSCGVCADFAKCFGPEN